MSRTPSPHPLAPQQDERWEAVVRCDRRADGRFFYAVATTGIYCRPSCRSKTPRREHVRFFESAEAAERAGYRACKRCQPKGAGLEEDHARAVATACRIINAADEPPRLEELARQVGMSRYHFHRVFKKVTGLSPRAYAVARRAEAVRERLPGSERVADAIYDSGYQSNGRFYEKSKEILGMNPKTFKTGGAGEEIRFAVAPGSLGCVLVAASEKGVCAIFMGDAPEALVDNLRQRFPKARLIEGDADFEETVAAVVRGVENPSAALALPLDIRGTLFQQKVWEALRRIPPGSTTTYTAIAGELGMPRAVRAVAQACGANKLAVVIPCHRVIRRDGSLCGYRWGVERKRELLDREKKDGSFRLEE